MLAFGKHRKALCLKVCAECLAPKKQAPPTNENETHRAFRLQWEEAVRDQQIDEVKQALMEKHFAEAIVEQKIMTQLRCTRVASGEELTSVEKDLLDDGPPSRSWRQSAAIRSF